MPRITKEAKRNKRSSWIVFITAILLVVFVLIFIFWSNDEQPNEDDLQTTEPTRDVVVRDYYECIDAGYTVVDIFPGQCTDSEGVTHVQSIGNINDYIDEFTHVKPYVGERISSPVTITGQASGSWFFEAEFPVELKDDSGKILATGIASTTEDWMTQDIIPFSLTLAFEKPLGTERGELYFYASNPSGMPEFDKTLHYPIRFEKD
ncbi:Gmad2 immunoglobulin-like domain-containing protein [Patescibacteria group bacterium]